MSKRKSNQTVEIEEEPENTARPPDRVVRERLIDSFDNFEQDLAKALQESRQEYQQQLIQTEEEFQRKYQEEFIRRKEIFAGLVEAMKRVQMFDQEVKQVFEIIEPIFQNFAEQRMDSLRIEGETYDLIFQTVSSLRIKNMDCLQHLSNLIIREN